VVELAENAKLLGYGCAGSCLDFREIDIKRIEIELGDIHYCI